MPFEPDSVAATGLISEAGVADLAARVDIEHEPLARDASVGEVMRPRVGDEVFERLVDPLLGGINAGNADGLSIEAGAPQLFAAACGGGSLRDTLRAQVTAGQAAAGGPVFNGVEGGNRRIIDTLVEQLGSRVRLGETVVAIERDGTGWVVVTSDARFPADRVVLATPAWITAGLVAPFAPTAATALADLVYGDAVLVTYVVDKAGIEHDLAGSGFLVPRSEGLLMTACSWASSKWRHYDDGRHAILRVSAGRTDDRRWLDLDPAQLLDHLGAELALTVGLHAEPVTRITPWRQSLPQYRPGHMARCDEIDTELAFVAEGLIVAGAQMRGSGFRRASDRVVPPSRELRRRSFCSAGQAANGSTPSPRPSIGRSRPSRVSLPPSWSKISAMCRIGATPAASMWCRCRQLTIISSYPERTRASRRACRKQAVDASSEPLGRSSTTLSGCVTEWSAHALGVLPWVPWAEGTKRLSRRKVGRVSCP